MNRKEQLIAEFEALIPFVESLRKYGEGRLTSPIGEGKWSLKDMLSHFMLWDRYYIERALEPIAERKDEAVIAVSNQFEIESYNQQAIAFAEGRTASDVMDLMIETRQRVLYLLEQIPEDLYDKSYSDLDGDPFNIAEYVTDMTGHDGHHLAQMKDYILTAD
ncbi:DinB family protein [Paenibacillus sp. NPDC058071]|uniref:DinB family protein n=1 Tax=Paenibacillus sp. NPDC058071 TaxID=3346326 RepID=UPI0036DD59BB